MKKRILLLFLLLVIFLPINVQALNIDKNNLTIEKGKSEIINLSTNTETEITEIQFTLVYTSYDVPAYFNVEPGLTDSNPNGIVHKISFPTPISGNIKLGTIRIDVVNNPKITVGTINIHSAKATATNGEIINLKGQTINATIGTPTEVENNEPDKTKETEKKNLLEKIESKIVNIELKDNTYEYSVKIKDEIEELDLKVIPKEEKYKVEISNQKISELKDNQIIITVSDGDYKEEYKITVNKIKVEEIEVDDEVFESTYQYKGKWIVLIIIMTIILLVGLILTKKK